MDGIDSEQRPRLGYDISSVKPPYFVAIVLVT
jgi:hypothetical protein